jgi:hypothetical protein
VKFYINFNGTSKSYFRPESFEFGILLCVSCCQPSKSKQPAKPIPALAIFLILHREISEFGVLNFSVLFSSSGFIDIMGFMGLGELPKEYNRKVHGPYDPAVFYGKSK